MIGNANTDVGNFCRPTVNGNDGSCKVNDRSFLKKDKSLTVSDKMLVCRN